MKYKLSEIMDIIGGGTPKTSKPEYWNGDIPWLSVKDFNNDYRYVYETEKTITQAGLDNSSTKLLKRNDSIISARGTVGEMAMIPYPMAFNQSCYGLRAKEGLVDEEYLYYLIKHNVVVLKKNTHGSVFDTITRDTFDDIEVELPSLVEQKIVASILRDLDDKIEVNNKINKNLEQQELARKFKDNNDPMKIAIVVDMWLTGFDVPSLATMYVYKPMHGYNLMQAIARVNRVFKDKEGGLIVDYVGIASALKAAMKEYTKRDQSKYGDMNIAKMAYPKFQEKLQVCKDLLHGFDFSGFVAGSPLTMAKLITGGVNFILDASVLERKDLFLKEAMLLKQSHSLCSSMTTEQERHEAAYMEALRSTVIKITYGGTGGKNLSLTEINDQINELLKAAVQSEGVISLFDSSKSGGENFSLFDPAVLDEISRMKGKNIAVEILKKLMAEQVALYKRTNVVQSQKFSEKIAQLMNSYYNGLITNEEVIKELLKTAEEIANLYKNGQELGLSQEELAFYDALTKPEHIKDFYKNDELIALTRELTEMLRKNRTIDWQKKETARAQMRKMVKRLLKKYKYPPEDYDFAISTVISQCELWTDNVEPRKEEKLYKYVSEIELSKVAEDTVSYGEKK